MGKFGYTRSEKDHCCYFKYFDNSYIILLLYVDDMFIAGPSIEKIKNLKKELSKQFEMKDLKSAKQHLGMRITRDKAKRTLKLSNFLCHCLGACFNPYMLFVNLQTRFSFPCTMNLSG